MFWQRINFAHFAVGFLFVCVNFNAVVASAMFVMIFSFYIIMFLRKRYVWMLTIVWLAILNMLKQKESEQWLASVLNETEIYDGMIALSWLLLRVTSFAIDYCNTKNRRIEKMPPDQMLDHFSTLHYLSYSFYLPIYLHGPPIIYERYAKMYANNRLYPIEESVDRFKELMISLIRICCVYVLNEICMHFIYANVIIQNSDVNIRIFFSSLSWIADWTI